MRPHDFKTTKPVTSLTREFMAKCPAPIIGVTGTKGKGTTSALITKILEAAGHKVWLGGNIGTPALDFLDKVKKDHWVVLEMSSYQLMDLTTSPHIGVMLMIAPDHLNYHVSMSEYVEAKGNIFRFQKVHDLAVFKESDPEVNRMVGLSKGQHIPYGHLDGAYVKDGGIWFRNHQVTSTDQVGLLGKHNLENVCAAVAATWNLVEDSKPMAKAIKEFTGLPHRLEEVRRFGGVRFIDDSFGSVPIAAVSAIRAVPEPKVMIVGGFDKGNDLSAIAEGIAANNVKHVVSIGATGSTIAKQLEELGYNRVKQVEGTMKQIVHAAWELAEDGDAVLLAPGCASFDMFKNFEDRGNQFRKAVEELPA